MVIPEFHSFVNESDGVAKLRSMLHSRYEDFVERLANECNDPKLLAAIQAGRFDGKPEDERIAFPSSTSIHTVRNLLPTQWEVDVDKSLMHQLSYEAGKCNQLLTILSGSPVTIKSPLVILNGRYIIDGHHRWSQVYAMNPDARIVCFDLRTKERIDPIDFLRAMQLAIATVAPIEPNKVEGRNLFEISKNDALLYMLHGKGSMKGFKGISTGSVMAFQMKRNWVKTAEDVAEIVLENILTMQDNNPPIDGAPDRNVMPQTDTAIGRSEFKEHLKSGIINYKEPLAANEMKIPDFEQFLDESSENGSPDIYIANRLSKGNQVFPAEIHFEPNGITIRIPGIINDKSRFIAFSDIDGVGIITPIVGWSTIELWHGGVKMEAHGFTKAEAREIKDRIENGKLAASR